MIYFNNQYKTSFSWNEFAGVEITFGLLLSGRKLLKRDSK